MRVISGSARGTALTAPDGMQTRPTADRTREALFSILMPYVAGCTFLDLFSGSGAVGIEALSRGAAHCCFVDNESIALSAIKRNLDKTKLSARAEVLRSDAVGVARVLSRQNKAFDIVFLDPPYDNALAKPAADAVLAGGLLAEGGLLIIEHRAQEEAPVIEGLRLSKQKRYGAAAISIYEVTS